MTGKYDAFFVSSQVHQRDVELADGTVHKLFFREVPAQVYRKFQIAEASSDEEVRSGSLAKLIAASLCEEDGSEAITYEQACNLKASASSALIDKVLEVNGRKPGNDSPPRVPTGSGTSSPSPLAAEQ